MISVLIQSMPKEAPSAKGHLKVALRGGPLGYRKYGRTRQGNDFRILRSLLSPAVEVGLIFFSCPNSYKVNWGSFKVNYRVPSKEFGVIYCLQI